MSNNQENIQFLREHPVFQRLSEGYLEELSGHMEMITLLANDTLFHEGDAADSFYIVVEGTLDLYANLSDDDDQWIQLIDVGEVIGWSWLVPPYRWAFSARSRDGAILMRFNAEAIRNLCDRDPVFGYGTMKQICSLMLERLHTVRAQMGQKLRDLEKKK